MAAGGPRRTPKEAVDALIEAIDIIRQVWAGDTVHAEGEHYQVKGLHGGPRPAHDIPVWLGSYKPRMLRVTADLADAWIPSMGYAEPHELSAMNALMDERAEANGRGPQAIRRMYNVFGRFGSGGGFLQGTARDWAEQLAGLAIDEGVSHLHPRHRRRGRRYAGSRSRWRRRCATRSTRSAGCARVARAATRPPKRAEEPEAITVTPTPPPPSRFGDELPWDETTRPRYPAPADASYTEAQQAYPQHLIDIHDALRAELTQLRDVVDQVRRGLLQVGQARSVINTMTMRQNNWTLGAYCESYCRIVTGHHTLEDRSMFAFLRQRDPDAAPVVDRLAEEHEVIADVLEQVDRALVGLVGAEPREASERWSSSPSAVDLLSDTLLSHLSYEERELLHPLAQHGLG